jgi:hypothetical protein
VRYRRILPLVALVATGLVGTAFVGPSPPPGDGAPAADRLVRPDGTGSYVWPYTSRRRSVDGRTLALNVLVRGDPVQVRRALEGRSDVDWTAVEGDADVAVGGSPWRPARGAARYTYVTSDTDGGGRWVTAAYQLGTGAYLGRRVHVRAYPAPSGNWTALQAHAEYWDWFRLRHTVTGVAAGGRFVERDLRDEPFVAGVSREYHGLGGGGGDGWLTVIEFAPAAFLLGLVLPVVGRSRATLADASLPVAVVALVLGVRAAGVVAEGLVPTADPKLFAAVLYPVLAVGAPAVAARLARGRPPTRTALLAAAGLGAGVLLDLGGVGVTVLPVRLALHRIALAGALGLLAFGAARADRRTVALGAAAWVLALAAPLAGVV